MARVKTVADVAGWGLCLGCGACAYICPEKRITLEDRVAEGIRPALSRTDCGACVDCLKVCPAWETDHRGRSGAPGTIPSLRAPFGPVLEVWEGHAADAALRHEGASGGVLSALGVYCLEGLKMAGVLHAAADPSEPLRNRTRLSRTRAELLAAAGSRYAPASVCDRLDWVEAASGPCAVIGQPSEAAALEKACALRPALREKVGVSLSFFCAGSPPTLATQELVRQLGLDPGAVASLRYRGRGWPGRFSVTLRGQAAPAREISYADSWAFLQQFRPFSVQLWPDGGGEAADIVCGDPWYRPVTPGEEGSSLVLARTERGRRILAGALQAGYLCLEPAPAERVLVSQGGLAEKRAAIWGRLAALRLLGRPAPRHRGLPLLRLWLGLPALQKLKSVAGTLRRVVTGRYDRRFKPAPLRVRAG